MILQVSFYLFRFVFCYQGQENLISMKAVWRAGKDGFVFVYAINNKQSFKDMI